MHPRAVIRDYVATLIAGNTSAADRVYTQRVDPVASDGVPYIVVKARRDRVLKPQGEEPPMYQRTLYLQLRIVAQGDEDVANDLADAVEALVLKDFTLGGNAVRAVLAETVLEPDTGGADVFWDASIDIDVDYISIFA
jgi:hypothetical protein